MANACEWDAVQHFQSSREYEDFVQSLDRQIGVGVVRAVPVDPTQSWGTSWDEHWYECVSSGEVWRLVAPDPPFRGVFKKLSESNR